MYLGIDIGTSAVKLSLISDRLTQIGEAQAALGVSTPKPYWSEQEPEDWWRALVAASASLRDRHDLSGVKAIGLSGQMHGAVLLDAAGTVIRPAILWNDGRSHAECADLAQRLPRIGEMAGVPPLPGFTAPKLMWLARHEPEAHRRIAHVLLPKDYVGWRLHGAFATDRSDAAGTLWLDQTTRQWSPELCAATDTDLAWLPTLYDGSEAAGQLSAEAAAALGLPPGLPIAAGGGDGATGAVGTGSVRDGVSFLSLGTSGQFFVATDGYRPNPAQMVHAFAHCIPGMWFQMAVMLNGARPMQWCADLLDTPLPVLLQEASEADPAGVPLFLPYLTGERSPHGDPHIRGGFYGLTDGMSRGHMMHAVVNAIAYSFADAAASLRAAGTEPRDVLAIGGGSRSDLLLQAIADVLNLPISRSTDPTTGPALGAARLAAVASGGATLEDLAVRPVAETVFTPRDTEAHQAGLAAYRALYKHMTALRVELLGESQ